MGRDAKEPASGTCSTAAGTCHRLHLCSPATVSPLFGEEKGLPGIFAHLRDTKGKHTEDFETILQQNRLLEPTEFAKIRVRNAE